MSQLEALVTKTTGKNVELRTTKGDIIDARIRGKLKLLDLKQTNPVAVGDKVIYSLSKDGEASIERILDRKNYVIRKATRLSKQTQIIASNLDMACLVVSIARPTTPLGFVDRFLTMTTAYDIPTILIVNKLDLISEDASLKEKLDEFTTVYKKIGYQTLSVSANTGEGIEDLRNILKDKLCLFSGQSGVGKSSLANSLLPALGIKTKQVSNKNNKGQHTTTFAQMYDWSFGGGFIDTPGVKEFGMVDIERSELKSYFVEIFEYSKQCKFDNCLHISEPKCAVVAAVENGDISETRYKNYLHILEECG